MVFALKKKDLPVISVIALLILSYLFIPAFFVAYLNFNSAHGLIASFIKFAILATFGESLALRIRRGIYFEKGFGLLSRAFVWGILGMLIKLVFILFATGIPNVVNYLHQSAPLLFDGSFFSRLGIAFSISLTMNVIFSPWLFVVHSITNEHIHRCEGNPKKFFSPIQIQDIFINLNWAVIWNFSIKKTIPIFWIPAHTITFLLPPDHQILMAALLSFALGIILAFAKYEGANFKGLAIPILKKLAESTMCTATFGQIRGDYIYNIAQYEVKAKLQLSLNLGQRFPINYGAHGKTILAFSSAEEEEKIPLDFDYLTAELAKCRKDGFAFSKSRAFPGVNVISAPVFDTDNTIVGCILILGVFGDQKIDEYGEYTKKVAQEMTIKLKK